MIPGDIPPVPSSPAWLTQGDCTCQYEQCLNHLWTCGRFPSGPAQTLRDVMDKPWTTKSRCQQL